MRDRQLLIMQHANTFERVVNSIVNRKPPLASKLLSQATVDGIVFRYAPRTTVYFLVRNDEIVYVGKTMLLTSRLLSHEADGKRFDSVYYVYPPNGEADVDALECALIHYLDPEYNMRRPSTEDPSWHDLVTSCGIPLRPKRAA